MESHYGATTPFQSSAIIDVDGQRAVENVAIHLMPYGVISGGVITKEGDPVDEGMVQVLSTVRLNGVRKHLLVAGITPNDLGEYRVGGLKPGTYYVRFQPRPRGIPANSRGLSDDNLQSVATYFPSGLGLWEATPIQLGLGEHASSTDIVVRESATFAVYGKLLIGGQVPSMAALELLPKGEEPTAVAVGNSFLDPDGSFHLNSVVPGEYELHYVAGTEAGHTLGRVTISVVNQDVDNAWIDALLPISVAGNIAIDGEIDVHVDDVHVELVMTDAFIGPSYATKVETDGSFHFKNVSPGRYWLRVTPPSGMYLTSARYGVIDALRSPLVLARANQDLDIVLQKGSTDLSGQIIGANERQETRSAYYVVIPVDRDIASTDFRVGVSDSSSRFTVKDLAPGHYRVFAFSTLDLQAIQNPHILNTPEKFGARLDLATNAQATVTIELISAKDAKGIFSLGR